MSNISAQKYLISGRVQGVGFRWFVRESAKQLGLEGTVKNLYDGRVEVFAQGDLTSMYKFRELLQKGPAMSRVDNVAESDENINKNLKEFKVIY
jgi:acylphosphatase